MSDERTKIQRQSGIELMKVIAMFLIVLSHAAWSIGDTSIDPVPAVSSEDPQEICLIFFRYLGYLGNLMFLIPSAWFLTKSEKVKGNKIAEMVADSFVISVAWFAAYLVLGGNDTRSPLYIFERVFFPVTFGSNWYITCYLLLYAIHPLLNLIIGRIDRKTHFAYSLAFFVLYCVIRFVYNETYVYSNLIAFVGIYFMVAYCKKYMLEFFSSRKTNLRIFFIGTAGWAALLLLTNFVGNRMALYHGEVQHWMVLTNPFHLMMAFSLFHLLRLSPIRSKAINGLSSLSLLIYIIHDNFIFRQNFRFLFYDYAFTRFPHDLPVAWVLLYATILFLGSFLIAFLYRKLFQPTVHKIADKVLAALAEIYGKIEAAAMKLK